MQFYILLIFNQAFYWSNSKIDMTLLLFSS